MAQRSFRYRKEATVSSLQKKVQDLGSTSEEMSEIFKSLHRLSVTNGLLHREPEFGHQLELVAKRFVVVERALFAGATHEDRGRWHRDDEVEHGHRNNDENNYLEEK